MDTSIIQFLRDNKDRYSAQQLKSRLLDQGYAQAEIDSAVSLVFGRIPSPVPPAAQAQGEPAVTPAVRPGHQVLTIMLWLFVIVFFLPVLRAVFLIFTGS